MTVAAVVFRRDLAGLFTDDGITAENACLRIMCILVFEPVCSLYEIPAGALRGAGHPFLPAVSTVVGTCVFRIVWIFTVFRRMRSLKMLYYAFPLSWVVTIALVALCFFVTKPFSERC